MHDEDERVNSDTNYDVHKFMRNVVRDGKERLGDKREDNAGPEKKYSSAGIVLETCVAYASLLARRVVCSWAPQGEKVV